MYLLRAALLYFILRNACGAQWATTWAALTFASLKKCLFNAAMFEMLKKTVSFPPAVCVLNGTLIF